MVWSFTLVHHVPIDLYASDVIARLAVSQLAVGPLSLALGGLLGTVFAWGFLTRRVWGYMGSTVMAGLWVVPIGIDMRMVLFAAFWYLLLIHKSVRGG